MTNPKYYLLIAAVTYLLFARYAFANSPHIFWVSDPVRSGETVLITGDNLGINPKILARRLQDSGDNSVNKQLIWYPLKSIQANNQSVKFEIPAHWENGIFEVTVDKDGESVSRLLNAPVVYWLQGEGGAKVLPGSSVRIFGRNIQAPDKVSTIELVHKKTGKSIQVKAENGSLWEARFLIPFDFPVGDYTVSIHNGWGGTGLDFRRSGSC